MMRRWWPLLLLPAGALVLAALYAYANRPIKRREP